MKEYFLIWKFVILFGNVSFGSFYFHFEISIFIWKFLVSFRNLYFDLEMSIFILDSLLWFRNFHLDFGNVYFYFGLSILIWKFVYFQIKKDISKLKRHSQMKIDLLLYNLWRLKGEMTEYSACAGLIQTIFWFRICFFYLEMFVFK